MKRVATLLLSLFVIAILGYFAYAVWGPIETVGLRAPVRQDDFVYSVVGVSLARELGPPGHQVSSRCESTASAPAPSGCMFWVVSVNVENHAERVPYTWDPAIVYLQHDIGGARQTYDADGQRAFDAQNQVDRVIPPGIARTFGVVFRAGGSSRQEFLGYSNGMLMGDFFNDMAYSRVRVRLEPRRRPGRPPPVSSTASRDTTRYTEGN